MTGTSLGERVSKRRSDLGMSQEELAKKSGVSRVAISKAELGLTKNFNGDTLFNVARALRCNAEWLQTGKGDIDYPVINPAESLRTDPIEGPRVYHYPKLDWNDIAEYDKGKENYNKEQLVSSTIDAGIGAFWVEVNTDSMSSPVGLSIPIGMLILIKISSSPKSGKLVIAKNKNTNEVIFRRYIEEAGDKYLKPLNSNYSTLKINDGYNFIGVVLEAKWGIL